MLDADGDERISFEEFDANLNPEQRTLIEAKLNEDGVMRSLYVPPEKWNDTRTLAEPNGSRRSCWMQQSGNALRQMRF